MLDLLANKEESVATTLLILPFCFQSFDDFHAFSLEVEDVIMPLLEREVRGPIEQGSRAEDAKDNNNKEEEEEERRRPSLLQKLKAKEIRNAEGVLRPSKAYIHKSSSSSLSSSSSGQNAIQLAFFHPLFAWAPGGKEKCPAHSDSVIIASHHNGTNDDDNDDMDDFNSPLNFEKRSPFPVINLLRADRIREWADEDKTDKIATGNLSTLKMAGSDKLVAEFEDIIKIALS